MFKSPVKDGGTITIGVEDNSAAVGGVLKLQDPVLDGCAGACGLLKLLLHHLFPGRLETLNHLIAVFCMWGNPIEDTR